MKSKGIAMSSEHHNRFPKLTATFYRQSIFLRQSNVLTEEKKVCLTKFSCLNANEKAIKTTKHIRAHTIREQMRASVA